MALIAKVFQSCFKSQANLLDDSAAWPDKQQSAAVSNDVILECPARYLSKSASQGPDVCFDDLHAAPSRAGSTIKASQECCLAVGTSKPADNDGKNAMGPADEQRPSGVQTMPRWGASLNTPQSPFCQSLFAAYKSNNSDTRAPPEKPNPYLGHARTCEFEDVAQDADPDHMAGIVFNLTRNSVTCTNSFTSTLPRPVNFQLGSQGLFQEIMPVMREVAPLSAPGTPKSAATLDALPSVPPSRKLLYACVLDQAVMGDTAGAWQGDGTNSSSLMVNHLHLQDKVTQDSAVQTAMSKTPGVSL